MQPVPDSLLINGLGHFNCSMAVPARPLDCVGNSFDLSKILPTDSSYKLRVVNTGYAATTQSPGAVLANDVQITFWIYIDVQQS